LADIWSAKGHVRFAPNTDPAKGDVRFTSESGHVGCLGPIKWQENIKQASTRFQNVPGLIRKQFLYNDKGIGGGVYLWETREAAENCYFKSPWGESVRRASGGNEPEIAWFETGVVVDNESHQIKTAA
jgi:hypothetical protein